PTCRSTPHPSPRIQSLSLHDALPISRALDLLKFSDKKAAHMIYKVVYSATSNAENNLGADVDELKVKAIMVDEGPTLKRFMARADRKSTRLNSSHVKISYAVFCLKKK